jgi:ABC-type sugar transport system permease subunit
VTTAPASITHPARVGAEAPAEASSLLAPWLFLTPFLLLFATFTAYPLFGSLWLSTRQTFGPGSSRPVGIGNFTQLVQDPLFWQALRNTVVFTGGSVLVQLPLALLLAMALNRPGLRGRSVLRLIMFAPVLVGVVFVGMMFAVIFEKRTGMLNQLLHGATGWSLDFPWLETYVMPALILATLWQYVGYNMVYFLAALQNVPQELDEAACMDGANVFSRFRHIVLPAIRPVATFVVLLSIVGSFQLFELPYILFNGTGGPDNRGLSLVLYLYQCGFQTGDLGYASAIGWAMAAVLMTCAVLQRVVHAQGETP